VFLVSPNNTQMAENQTDCCYFSQTNMK